ncbi:hypothetical protein [Brevundimonas sp.]|uniref:hypothetical protein n=1 Tax=Brevundimonas sp. TaxID=1871086 RepID=UPI0035B13EC3
MSLYEFRRPSMIMVCEGMSLRVQVRDFEPKQAWPQPELSIAFGAVERSAVPDVRNIGEQVAYEISFRIADDVLDQISAGSPIEARFNDQSKAFLATPKAEAQAFSSGCAALLPPPLRRPN